MADNRSILRDLGVGLITSAIGFGGAWFLQDRSHTADLTVQRNAAAEAAATQKAIFEQQLEGQRAIRAEQNTLALYGEWLDPVNERQRRLVIALVQRPDRRGYTQLMSDPSVSEAEKDSLGLTLQFFSKVRAMAAAKELDIPKARELFGPATAWWSSHAMSALLSDVAKNGQAPGEVVNAAYGLAALGGDLERLAPPLDLEKLGYYVGLGPQGGGTNSPALPAATARAPARAATSVAPYEPASRSLRPPPFAPAPAPPNPRVGAANLVPLPNNPGPYQPAPAAAAPAEPAPPPNH